jgi:predicted nucleotide-binding protein
MSTSVFVVKHEKNVWAYDAIRQFLEELGVNVITWEAAEEEAEKALWKEEGAERPPTVIDIVDSGFKLSTCAVVLMTPDDEARLRAEFVEPRAGNEEWEPPLKPQPRPNVLFEAGMAWGRHSNRTVFVEFDDLPPIEWPSDLRGLYTVRLGKDEGGPRRLARRVLGPEGLAEAKPDDTVLSRHRFTRPTVPFTLNVTVPESTRDSQVYIAGTLDRLVEPGPLWKANGQALRKIADGRWTIEVTGKQGVEIEYKLTLGSWKEVEKTEGCAELRNRRLVFGAEAREQTIRVEAWRGRDCRDGD